jgi:hypothetical protein
MKKIIILFFVLLISVSGYSQFTGSGTSVSPYSGGTLKTNQLWSASNSPIYVSGDLTVGTPVDAGHLTIEAGVTVRFVTPGADLIITGLGQLTSDGTSGNHIRFTADADNDGIYGETGETWGHISLQNMGSAGASSITYSIIEFGRKDGALNTVESVGGGLFTDFNNITISDNTFQNNYALFGGAIFVNISRNPSISRCIFRDNSVREAGGAIYLHNSSSSVVTNCIFDGNYSKGQSASNYSGGGVQFGLTITNARIINSVFVNNNSDRTGDSFYTLSGGSVINSIFWGSSDQTGFYSSSGTISYSAIQGYTPGSHFSNCFGLNASDTDPAGPNFTDLISHDFSIKFISPCRDAGTTSTPPVSTDYLYKSRIGVYDIGAYEVQYSRWKGTTSTSWSTATNWEASIDPSTGTGDVIVPTGLSNYPVDASNPDFTIGSGKQMIVEQGARVTLGNLTNNGILKLRSTSAGFASLIISSYTRGTGATEEIQMFLTGGGTKTPLTYKWHYISSPVTSLAVSTFAPTYTLNVAQWVESRPATSLSQGWVAYDGYIYSTGGMGGPTFSTLTPGKGYDYFRSADNTYTFGGLLNTSDVNVNLSYKAGNDALWGYNLIGNPFTSGLDWNYIITHSFPANTTKSLYFTRNSVLCTYINGVGVPGDVNGIIPPMQGFFSKTYSSGNTIVMAAAARTHNNIHATYKGSQQEIPLVRLALADSALTDETVVRFDDLAKSYLDNDFDAVKMFLDPSLPSIHTSLSGTDYAINGLPFPETEIEIPVVINIATDSVPKTIIASQLQGLDNYYVTLKDNTTGFITDLKTNSTVTFTAAKGNIPDRFILKISTNTTGVEKPARVYDAFNIYSTDNLFNIQTLADSWDGKNGSVKVLDLTGKIISYSQHNEFRKNNLISVDAPLVKGLYLVELKSGMMRYVGKVIVK